jgi:hypothetical protein
MPLVKKKSDKEAKKKQRKRINEKVILVALAEIESLWE